MPNPEGVGGRSLAIDDRSLIPPHLQVVVNKLNAVDAVQSKPEALDVDRRDIKSIRPQPFGNFE